MYTYIIMQMFMYVYIYVYVYIHIYVCVCVYYVSHAISPVYIIFLYKTSFTFMSEIFRLSNRSKGHNQRLNIITNWI